MRPPMCWQEPCDEPSLLLWVTEEHWNWKHTQEQNPGTDMDTGTLGKHLTSLLNVQFSSLQSLKNLVTSMDSLSRKQMQQSK